MTSDKNKLILENLPKDWWRVISNEFDNCSRVYIYKVLNRERTNEPMLKRIYQMAAVNKLKKKTEETQNEKIIKALMK
jgi:predicted transcriptional regulator